MQFDPINPNFWAIAILICTTVFSVLWFLDALKHKELVKTDITSNELRTHRNILISSGIMELALVAMFWFQLESLPFFIAAFITRTAHEFLDELKYHADRCSSYENFIHLGMWVTVLSKTILQFIWGFFYQYQGIETFDYGIYCWAGIVLLTMGITSFFEWKRGK
jgi:hypothetical protein